MKKFFYKILLALLIPTLTRAESLSGIKDLLKSVSGIIKQLIPITFGLAVMAFFYGIARFVMQTGNPESKNKNKDILYWGVIAIAVMTSIWGLVGLLQNILGINKMSGDAQKPSGYDELGT